MTDLRFDSEKLKEGYDYIAGIDEVGRGCLFGDVVAACVMMPLDETIAGVTDSKKLSPRKRAVLEVSIKERAIFYSFARKSPEVIDAVNIKQATRLAMKEAAQEALNKFPDKKILFLIDAETVDLDCIQEPIIHGDDLSYTIACASILAKEFRDRLCIEWAEVYPGYGIEKHKGYGTKQHREAILALGPTPGHRRSFLGKILKP
ncbi:ribonuclease HII [Aedoeadaptatus urinae]|uniref:ribonuclease HII n=1 Tax=Aedoeadaptatus urinae TaxID=1871017 RepID=UPI00097D6667|nr:ribonuclease HII [Peptoniphilus urinae]